MRPLGMQPSERPLDPLVRRQMQFGFICFYHFAFPLSGSDTRRDGGKHSPARSAGTAFVFCRRPTYFLSLFCICCHIIVNGDGLSTNRVNGVKS